MRARFAIVALAFSLANGSSTASEYRVSVTREDQDLYLIDGQDMIIKTQYCYEYTYAEDAFLRTSFGGGKLLFLDSEESCDIEGIYAKANLNAGSYRVQLSKESDNWYRVGFDDTYVRTSICLELALSEEVLLEITGFGSGKAYFLHSENTCSVESVYVKQNV